MPLCVCGAQFAASAPFAPEYVGSDTATGVGPMIACGGFVRGAELSPEDIYEGSGDYACERGNHDLGESYPPFPGVLMLASLCT